MKRPPLQNIYCWFREARFIWTQLFVFYPPVLTTPFLCKLQGRLNHLYSITWGEQEKRAWHIFVTVVLGFEIKSVRKFISLNVPEYLQLNLAICLSTVNCAWGRWSPCGGCSTSCGTGTRTRSRSATPAECGGSCPGAASDKKSCYMNPNPGEI